MYVTSGSSFGSIEGLHVTFVCLWNYIDNMAENCYIGMMILHDESSWWKKGSIISFPNHVSLQGKDARLFPWCYEFSKINDIS